MLVLRRAHVFVVPPTLYSLYEGREGFRDAVGVADSPLLLSCTILASLHIYTTPSPLCALKPRAGRVGIHNEDVRGGVKPHRRVLTFTDVTADTCAMWIVVRRTAPFTCGRRVAHNPKLGRTLLTHADRLRKVTQNCYPTPD